MKTTIIMLLALLVNLKTYATVTAMFHPYDNTFVAIAERLEQAASTIDLALYNIDDRESNPIIAKLSSPEMQYRIHSQSLKVRMIFEGYESKKKNQEKMLNLEKLGIDVRYLGSSRGMHHKFAVIDGGTILGSTITGSANWSMMSRRSYSENILYFDQKPQISAVFQEEFDLLWSISKEIGMAREYTTATLRNYQLPEGIDLHFNSTNNFEIKKNRLYLLRNEGWYLTRQLVEAIDNADKTISIATTRIRLRPVYEALLRAAARGVDIEIVVTMGEYEYSNVRRRMKPGHCEDVYSKDCSTGTNFAVFLSRDDFPGSENVDVRLKYFHVKKAVYLNKQMHSKYMIVDGEKILTGSFNWSYSAEFNHIENIVEMDGFAYPKVIKSFEADFDQLWNLRRDTFFPFVQSLETAIQTGTKIKCGFEPMALSYKQIDYMLAAGKRVGGKTTKACE